MSKKLYSEEDLDNILRQARAISIAMQIGGLSSNLHSELKHLGKTEEADNMTRISGYTWEILYGL